MNGAPRRLVARDAQSPSAITERLATFIATWTGHRPDAIRRAAVEQFVAATLEAGATVEDIYERAARRDPALTSATLAAVTVGETFFFRQPEHFRWVARSAARWSDGNVRAWSAGCATGEEAYSLAACLSDCVGPRQYTVLGTDLVDDNVNRARAGLFGSWSLRTSSPFAFPLLDPAPKGSPRPFSVVTTLRERVHFERHNLLDDPPPCPGGFHIILCRNVLLYFTPEAAAAAAARLVSALAPNGVLVFGALDIASPPEGLSPIGPPELSVFGRVTPARGNSLRPSRPPSIRSMRKVSGAHRLSVRVGPLTASKRPDERRGPEAAIPNSAQTAIAVGIHRRLLALIEHRQRAKAERLLDELRAIAPDYLPGLLEEALFHARAGRIDSARHAMHDLARKCEGLPGETVVHGPEDLSIEYYRIASRSFAITGTGAAGRGRASTHAGER